MKRRTAHLGVASLVALVAALAAVSAQAPAVKRTMLQQGDLSVSGREAIMGKAEFPAGGGTTGRHSHPGDEISYVLDGSVRLEIDGEKPRTLKAGDYFMVTNGKIHNAVNVGPGTATVLATYVVEKGKPLATPAK